jgi:hypothetical protein
VAATNALLLAEVSKQGHTVTCEPSEVIAADPAPASRGRRRMSHGGGVVPGLPWGDAASHVGLKHTSRTVDL